MNDLIQLGDTMATLLDSAADNDDVRGLAAQARAKRVAATSWRKARDTKQTEDDHGEHTRGG